jgi:hypothetical protein
LRGAPLGIISPCANSASTGVISLGSSAGRNIAEHSPVRRQRLYKW